MKISLINLFLLFACLKAVGTIHYVNPIASGANTGVNWVNAATDLRTVLAVSVAGDSIFLAAGNYNAGNDPYTLVSGIRIFGGFAPSGNPVFSDRNWTSYPSIFRGSSTNPIFRTISFSAPTYLDGVQITEASSTNQGAAMYVMGNNPFYISNTRFFNNNNATQGGIFYVLNGAVIIDNCIVEDNTNTDHQGGFIYSNNSTVTIRNSLITNNRYGLSGGVVYNLMGTLTVNNTRFVNNISCQLFFCNSGPISVTHSQFTGNSGGNTNIIAYVMNAVAGFTNCLFANNTEGSLNGTLFSIYGNTTRLTVANSTLFGNRPESATNAALISSMFSASSIITNSIVWGNEGALTRISINGLPSEVYNSINEGGPDAANDVLDTDPLFVNPSNAASGGLQLQAGSPAIDAGSNTRTAATLVSDLLGNPRIQNSRVDMGAYETPLPSGPIVTTSTGNTTYTLTTPPVAIDPAVRVTNAARPTLVSASVSITGNFTSGDLLSFTNSSGMGNITATYNPSTGTLSLSSAGGTATLAEWQRALQSIQYSSSNNATSLANRTVSFSVNDGASSSNIASKQIVLAAAPCLPTTSSTTVNICPSALPYSWNSTSYAGYGIYTITLQNAAGCDSIATLILNVSSTFNCLSLSLSSAPESCVGNDGSITVSGTGGRAPYQYSRDGINFQSTPVFSNLTNGTYTITIRDADRISEQASISVAPARCLTISTDITPTTCGNNNGAISVTITRGTSPYSYSINGLPFQSSNRFDGLAAGSYIVRVRDGNGLDTSVEVDMPSSSIGRIFAGNDTAVLRNESITLTALDLDGYGYTQFQWTPGIGLSNPTNQQSRATITTDIRFIVTAIAPNGCQARDTLHVAVLEVAEIFVPNSFTPNGDGKNDILKPIPKGLRELTHFTVYNRFGQQVFQTKDATKGWDGRMNGSRTNSEVFVWVAEGKTMDGRTIQRKGTILLLR